MLESKLSTEKRNNLDDSEFGLPKERKYPLNDESHVKSAIRFFNYCPAKKQKELSSNINKALKKFNLKVNVSDDNEFIKYIDEEYLTESLTDLIEPDETDVGYLEMQKNWLDRQLYIIDITNRYNISKCAFSSKSYVLENDTNREIFNLLRYRTIHVDRVMFNAIQYDPFLSDIDVLRIFDTIESLNYAMYIQILYNGKLKKIWLSVKDDSVILYYRERMSVDYVGIVLSYEFAKYITGISDEIPERLDLYELETVENNRRKNNVVNEGISINEDGDVQVSFSKYKSYMDEYMDIHRVLIENYKNGNYEAMKLNLALLFSLISMIEQDKRYKNREPEVVKARAFAINDFKTYLRHVQKQDSSFDFAKYYKESNFDKIILNIPRTTIIGIKKLLKTIIG